MGFPNIFRSFVRFLSIGLILLYSRFRQQTVWGYPNRIFGDVTTYAKLWYVFMANIVISVAFFLFLTVFLYRRDKNPVPPSALAP